MFKVKKLKEFKKHFQPEPKQSDVIYVAKCAFFRSEEDSYEHGVIGGGASWDYKLDISAKSIDDLFKKVKDTLWMNDVDDYNWSIGYDSNDGISCLRVCYFGDVNNDLASDSFMIGDWREGKERLWIVDGYIEIRKTTVPRFVPSKEMEQFAKRNELEILC